MNKDSHHRNVAGLVNVAEMLKSEFSSQWSSHHVSRFEIERLYVSADDRNINMVFGEARINDRRVEFAVSGKEVKIL